MTPLWIRRLRQWLRTLFSATDVQCIGCGRDVYDGSGFCPDCKQRVVFNNGKTCKRCGVALHGEEEYCGNCSFDKVYFDRAYSPFCYEGVVRDAILDMKFNGLGSYASVLARYLVFVAEREKLQYDVVTFVPASGQTVKKRRYNQAQLLAEEFCAILNKEELLQETVDKVRNTDPQEKLTRAQRKTNLVGSMRKHPGSDVNHKRVLLIDDIKTTGATVNECAKVLKKCGAASVVVITVASRSEKTDFEQEETE